MLIALRFFDFVHAGRRNPTGAIEGDVSHPIVGWQCEDCPYRSKCWARR